MSGAPPRERWRALIATSDKRGLGPFGRRLSGWGWDISATAGTAEVLRAAGVPVADAAVLSGHPSLLGGRLTTLSINVFGALLMRPGHARDDEDAAHWHFSPIHMLVVDFHDLEQAEPYGDQWIECIDVGGPAMLRAAAKNHEFVLPLVGPDSYASILDELAASNGDPARVSLRVRLALARRAFYCARRYDEAIEERLARRYELDSPASDP